VPTRKAPVELTIEGQGLDALQRKIKKLPNSRQLTRELNKTLRVAAKDLPDQAKDAARQELPQRGGLAARVASRPAGLQVLSGRNAGVRVRFKGVDAVSSNRGRLRHPVFGNREVWVNQAIKPGWFTDRMRHEAPKVRPDLLRAMERIAEKVADA